MRGCPEWRPEPQGRRRHAATGALTGWSAGPPTLLSRMSLDDLPAWAAELLEQGRVAHLGLLDEAGAPRVQPVTYARVGPALWSAIDDKPKRRPGELPARGGRLRGAPPGARTLDPPAPDSTPPARGAGLR